MLNDEFYASVYATLEKASRNGEWYVEHLGQRNLDTKLMEYPFLGSSIAAWRTANFYAYHQRYCNQKEYEFMPMKEALGCEYMNAKKWIMTELHLFKALQCIDYQCSTFDYWTGSLAEKELTKTINLLGKKLAERLPEYDKLPWGEIRA